MLKNYPQIKGFWFDGTWDKSWVSYAEFTYNLEKELREKHIGLIIRSRFRNDESGKRYFDSNGDLLGDYEQGWERKLPKTYESLNGNDWGCGNDNSAKRLGLCDRLEWVLYKKHL